MLSFIKWLATILLVTGTIINNLGIYPLGATIMAVAGLLWLLAAFIMRDRPLLVCNATLSFLGLISLLIGISK
jgi:hypothetical protein